MNEKLKKLLCLIILALTNLAAFAQASKEEVVVTDPGTLQEIIENLESSRYESLTIKGNLNAKDIAYLRSGEGRVAKVETLDISGVTLIPGDEPYAQVMIGSSGGAYGFKYGVYYISNEYKEIITSQSSGLGGSNVYYHIYNNDLAGAFSGSKAFDKVILPKSLDNVGQYIFKESSITEVVMTPNAKKIGEKAFWRCKNLETAIIPEMLEKIEAESFEETSIKEMTLPSTVKEIGARAFYYSKLEQINLENVEKIGETAFGSANELKGNLNLSKIDEIPASCFGGTKISSIIFSPNLKRIEKDAFSSCINIEKIIFDEGLEYIGKYAFSSCSKLTEVKLPLSIKQIGYGAFSSTPWGKSLVSENGITYIANIAYLYDSNYEPEGTEISFRNGTIAICNGFVFPNSVKEKITTVNLPESLEEIGDETFVGFKELGEVKLPSSLKKIGSGAFMDCPKFWCTFPDNLEEIGSRAFESCGTLSKVTLPESLKYIGGEVFSGTSVGIVYFYSKSLETSGYSPFDGCPSLNKVVIGSNVTKLSDGFFSYNKSLKSVVFEDIENSKLEYIGDRCFNWCENLSFEKLPSSLKHIGMTAFVNCSFKNNFNIDKIKYLGQGAFSDCKGFDTIRIPESVDTLGGVIFRRCKDLRTVEFNAKEFVGLVYSVNYVGGGGFSAEAANIFEDCDSIESVSIGSKVRYLPYHIFANCRQIKELKFESRENEIDNTLVIGDYAFSLCKGINELVLPEGVVSIGKEAFYNTNIKSINIPQSCKKIDTDAFYNEVLSSAFFYPAEPPIIERGFGNYYGDPRTTIYVPKDSYDLYTEVDALQGYPIKKMVNGGIAVEQISLDPKIWEGSEGTTFHIEATVYPEEASDKSLVWNSSDEAVATVDNEGNVTAVKAGEALITAVAADGSEISGYCKVVVKRILTESLQLDLDTWTGQVGASVKLKATIYPENATEKKLNWTSSNESIASVDEEGTVTAISVGEADITVSTIDGTEISVSCHVIVLPVPVETITLNPTSWRGKPGDEIQIEATVSPENATDRKIIWTSSDESIATVDGEGRITAIKVGDANIIATAADGSEVSATCIVTVEPVLVESIKLEPTEWEGLVGESILLGANVYPENATNKNLIWTSTDETVASVSSYGYVSALKAGEAYISVKADDGSEVSAVCHVKVTAVAVESIKLNPESWSGIIGENFKIETTIYPENASVKTLDWTSSDESVASVDAEGNVTALKEGGADIIAISIDGSNIKAICHVSVSAPTAESIILNPSSWSGNVGESFQIKASVYPESVKDKTLSWSSSDETTATVDAEGNVVALKVGEADILVKVTAMPEIIASCHVTVLPILVESIQLNPDSWSGEAGETFQIQATVYPENATDKTIEWKSSDDSIATVDTTGLVSVIQEGTCVISAEAADGSDITAECIITSVAGVEDILNGEEEMIDIYNMNGILIRKNCSKDYLKHLTPDIYLIRIGNQVKSVVIR